MSYFGHGKYGSTEGYSPAVAGLTPTPPLLVCPASLAIDASDDFVRVGPTKTTLFNGAENPLSEGGDWIKPSSLAVMKKAGGVALPGAGLIHSGAKITRPLFLADHYSEIVIGATATSYPACMTRMQEDGSGYVAFWNGGGDKIQLYRFDAAVGTLLGEWVPVTTAGDTMRLSSAGNTHTVSLNGVVLGSAIDATYPTGQPGIEGFADADASIASWTGDDTLTRELGAAWTIYSTSPLGPAFDGNIQVYSNNLCLLQGTSGYGWAVLAGLSDLESHYAQLAANILADDTTIGLAVRASVNGGYQSLIIFEAGIVVAAFVEWFDALNDHVSLVELSDLLGLPKEVFISQTVKLSVQRTLAGHCKLTFCFAGNHTADVTVLSTDPEFIANGMAGVTGGDPGIVPGSSLYSDFLCGPVAAP